MGFFDSIFGGKETQKFKMRPQDEPSTFARSELGRIAGEGFSDVPRRQVAGAPAIKKRRASVDVARKSKPLPGKSAERKQASALATELSQPREKFDFASSPEVQAIIEQTKAEGNLIANRIGRGLQKSGGFQATTGRDVLGRTVGEIESAITAQLVPFAEAERNRDVIDTQRRQNLVSILERLGLTDELRLEERDIREEGLKERVGVREEDRRERDLIRREEGALRKKGFIQAGFDADFQQKLGRLSQEDQRIALLQDILQLDPGRDAVAFTRSGRPGILEQIDAVGSTVSGMGSITKGLSGIFGKKKTG